MNDTIDARTENTETTLLVAPSPAHPTRIDTPADYTSLFTFPMGTKNDRFAWKTHLKGGLYFGLGFGLMLTVFNLNEISLMYKAWTQPFPPLIETFPWYFPNPPLPDAKPVPITDVDRIPRLVVPDASATLGWHVENVWTWNDNPFVSEVLTGACVSVIWYTAVAVLFKLLLLRWQRKLRLGKDGFAISHLTRTKKYKWCDVRHIRVLPVKTWAHAHMSPTLQKQVFGEYAVFEEIKTIVLYAHNAILAILQIPVNEERLLIRFPDVPDGVNPLMLHIWGLETSVLHTVFQNAMAGQPTDVESEILKKFPEEMSKPCQIADHEGMLLRDP
ncbi:uncharacterized protein EV422DRAFT_522485, partial [Fimicolochytrium jonesii]|uniref:uncharacterized protein n=1 Tax=Fimicolochytrium jonesii TaxID=1396493 RepID=UPI0022FE1819